MSPHRAARNRRVIGGAVGGAVGAAMSAAGGGVNRAAVRGEIRSASRNDVWLELLQRVRTLWIVKMTGTTLGISVFMMSYFWVLRNPSSEVTLMPLTALDRAIGFHPWALPIYLSLWVYISLGPAILRTGRELAGYGLATFAVGLIGLGIFIVWPTAVAPLAIDWTEYPSMTYLKQLDLAGNACPSLHVAFAVFTAIWLQRLLREIKAGPALLTLNWLWCLGILYSTVATLQHVVLDVLAGALLGGLVAAVHVFATVRFARRKQAWT